MPRFCRNKRAAQKKSGARAPIPCAARRIAARRPRGAGRFFLVCHEQWAGEARACFPASVELTVAGSVDAAVGFLADLNTPLAMVIIGAQMSAVNMAESFRHGRIYAAAGLRLAVLPLFTALVLLPFHLSPMLYCSMVILSGTPVAGSTSMFAQRFGRSTAAAAQVITLSNILSVVTLPVLAVLAQALSGAL